MRKKVWVQVRTTTTLKWSVRLQPKLILKIKKNPAQPSPRREPHVHLYNDQEEGYHVSLTQEIGQKFLSNGIAIL